MPSDVLIFNIANNIYNRVKRAKLDQVQYNAFAKHIKSIESTIGKLNETERSKLFSSMPKDFKQFLQESLVWINRREKENWFTQIWKTRKDQAQFSRFTQYLEEAQTIILLQLLINQHQASQNQTENNTRLQEKRIKPNKTKESKTEFCYNNSISIRLFIVDDHTLVRIAIKRILEDISGFKVVGEAQTGEEAIQLARELSPDVVLMDINMPGIGGLEATRKLLHFDPNIKILVLTVYSDDLFPLRLLQAGASGYITKCATTEEMVRAIRIINSGQRYVSPEIASRLAAKHLTEAAETPFEMLSERELQIAIMIANGVGMQAISEKLCLSPKTVNSYRYRIFDKLGVKSDVELARHAIYGFT